MIIDATRGSVARFVNHSCDPNCKMLMWTVAGKPRVALFAGERGIATGEELTYDYNFKCVQTHSFPFPSLTTFVHKLITTLANLTLAPSPPTIFKPAAVVPTPAEASSVLNLPRKPLQRLKS